MDEFGLSIQRFERDALRHADADCVQFAVMNAVVNRPTALLEKDGGVIDGNRFQSRCGHEASESVKRDTAKREYSELLRLGKNPANGRRKCGGQREYYMVVT